jgi:hypothetical protein
MEVSEQAKHWRAGQMVMDRRAWANLNSGAALTIVQDGFDVIACVWAEEDEDETAIAALIAAAPAMEKALREIDRLSLVILSAVNYADKHNLKAVSDALKAAREALRTAGGGNG